MTAKKFTDSELVKEHLAKLSPDMRQIVEAIRHIILGSDEHVAERIKWNSLSFYYSGEMMPFDPKEHKRDIAVFNLHKARILLVFPSGAKVSNESGVLEGDYTDGRRIITIKDLEDVRSKEQALREIIKEWINRVDK